MLLVGEENGNAVIVEVGFFVRRLQPDAHDAQRVFIFSDLPPMHRSATKGRVENCERDRNGRIEITIKILKLLISILTSRHVIKKIKLCILVILANSTPPEGN